jgi:hypothetical protein
MVAVLLLLTSVLEAKERGLADRIKVETLDERGSNRKIIMPLPGAGGNFVTIRIFILGPVDEATWCPEIDAGAVQSTVVSDCPAWEQWQRDVDAETVCEDRVVVELPGQVTTFVAPCTRAYEPQRSWSWTRGFGYGTHYVPFKLKFAHQTVEVYAHFIIPGGENQ